MEVTEELTLHNDYDLIFSDIRLADGDVFEAFSRVMPQSFVIFTTAYDEYAMKAIKNNGLDYLLKPIDADELRAAIEKLRLNREMQQPTVANRLNSASNDTHQYHERFLIPKGDELCIELSTKEEYLIQMLADFANVVAQAGSDYNPSIIANYAYDLVKEYNQFYHDFSILREENEAVKIFRLALSQNVAKVVKEAMGLLGIEVPERM